MTYLFLDLIWLSSPLLKILSYTIAFFRVMIPRMTRVTRSHLGLFPGKLDKSQKSRINHKEITPEWDVMLIKLSGDLIQL